MLRAGLDLRASRVTAILVAAVILLACANGANDNFKGVATLWGAGTLAYRKALALATAATFLGSLAALFAARGLLARFSGGGLVPQAVTADPTFPTAVAIGAALTVLVATRFGLPISTTHALTGGLLGAGWTLAGSAVDLERLAASFAAPLLLSPLLAAGLSWVSCGAVRKAGWLSRDACVCVGGEVIPAPGGAAAASSRLAVTVGSAVECRSRFAPGALSIEAGSVLNGCHQLSAAAVSFARGLNDTPKIAALLAVSGQLDSARAMVFVAAAMAIGGVFGARRVAETMSHRITRMEPGQALAGNVATAALVLLASHSALPVSTTHVSCGALFGIGAASGQALWRTIGGILAAWVTTLPLAALAAAAASAVLAR